MKQPSSRFWLLAMVLVASLGCGCDDGPFRQRVKPPQPIEMRSYAAPMPQAEARSDVPEASRILHFRTLLQSGRQKVQDKEYEEGRALLESALTVRPGDPRLLLEIGWAAFLAGDLDRAEEATGRALRGIADPDNKGVALYSLGRIAEKRGEITRAMELYQASLASRPNINVEGRIELLGPRPENGANQSSSVSILGPMAGPSSSLTAVCTTLIARHAEEGEQVGCEEKAAIGLEIGEPVLKRALLLPVWLGYSGSGLESAIEVMHYLVIETDAGFFHTHTFAWHLYNPGAFGLFEELRATLVRQQVLPEGSSEIVVRGLHQRHDPDVGLLEEERIESEKALVCGVLGAEPLCIVDIPLRYSYSRTVMKVEGVEEVPASEHTQGLPIRTSYHFDLRFDGHGNYTLHALAPTKGKAAVRDRARAGTFPLRVPMAR